MLGLAGLYSRPSSAWSKRPGREAVDAVGAREAGDASLGYSSCIWVAGWIQARFQLRPDDDNDDASVVSRVSFCVGAYGVLGREGDSPGWLFLAGWGLGPLSN